jgi:serine/threonine protein phosphatase PrpC
VAEINFNTHAAMYLTTEHQTPGAIHKRLQLYSVETITEKGSADLNEDVILQDNNVFGVFDGCTSLHPDDLPAGMTGGLAAARIAAESFRQHSGDLLSRAEEANMRIGAAAGSGHLTGKDKHRLWATSAAVVRLEESYFEFCQIGDCLIMVVRKDGTFTLLTPDTAHDRETLSLWKNSQAPAGMTIHELLAEQIRTIRNHMNIFYGVLNGEPEAGRFIRHGRESLDDVQAVLLFSDGLFLPKEDPHQLDNWSLFVDLYLAGGLPAIHEKVRSLESLDPGCRLYPRFKTHDDIAAIAITF